VYLATVTYGAVIVPILPDFKSDDLNNLINHSDAVLLFVDDKIFETLDAAKLSLIQGVISADDFSMISSQAEELKRKYQATEEKFVKNFPLLRQEDVKFSDIANDKLAVISYTG
jgi:long-chain acyl-CoA synthetase